MKYFNILILASCCLMACNSSSKKNTPIATETKEEVLIRNETSKTAQKPVDTIKKMTVESVDKNAEALTIDQPSSDVEKAVTTIQNEIKTTPKLNEKKPKVVTTNKKELTVSNTTKTLKKETTKVLESNIKTQSIQTKPSHEIWNKLTQNHVSSNGKVNYNAFKKELATLENYLTLLEKTPPSRDWSRNEKLAYWFNLYNASTVHLVASNYPVKSIKDINNGKPWDKKFVKSGDKVYSLNEIENTIVRPNFNEPRLHVAFNCAAVSCPNLLNEAFTAKKLEKQLRALAKQWIADGTKNDLSKKDEIKISQIFNWYKVDFKKGVISFINQYSSSAISEDAKIDFLEYNWELNN